MPKSIKPWFMGSDVDCESKKPISPLPKPNLVNERPIMKLFYFELFYISWHQTRLRVTHVSIQRVGRVWKCHNRINCLTFFPHNKRRLLMGLWCLYVSAEFVFKMADSIHNSLSKQYIDSWVASPKMHVIYHNGRAAPPDSKKNQSRYIIWNWQKKNFTVTN